MHGLKARFAIVYFRHSHGWCILKWPTDKKTSLAYLANILFAKHYFDGLNSISYTRPNCMQI